MTSSRLLAASVVGVVLLASLPQAGAADDWPAKVVTIEQLVPLTRMQIRVIQNRSDWARGINGPVVLRVHVDERGLVRRAVLVESSGSAAADNAGIESMSAMRFEPVLVDGQPTAVTLAVPLHFPGAKEGASR